MKKQRTAGVVVCSDSVYNGVKEDISGAVLEEMLKEDGFSVLEKTVVPDEKDAIANSLIRLCDEKMADLIITSGGTGLSKRDVTPEATLLVIDKQIPGIAEAIRVKGLEYTPKAMLSRGIAGVRGNTVIINLAGSVKAAREGYFIIKEVLEHALDIINGDVTDCGRRG
ncbi:MAG: MogA/MoaB family molybdenum cofactor biosynthesis protein [Clostridiales bacterium]|nr:MogA/MoaB family molybdenum cofactor biosynthesis protein [Clostridiales bacterium]